MPSAPRYVPFVAVFVPFALLLTAGNLYAEMSANLALGRVVASILLTAAIALPAVVLFFRYDLTAHPLAFRYWQLLWTFGFLACALHFYYAVGVWFDWDVAQIRRRQTDLVFGTNCLLLALWGLDVLFGLFGATAGGRPVRVLRWVSHALFVVAFVTAGVVFTSDTRTWLSYGFGVVLVALPLGGLALRWRW
jgi:hypothetical protein